MNEATSDGTGDKKSPVNFIEQIIIDDLKEGKNGGKIITRFPPEPNGYLHIGHAKAICLDFGLALKYGGKCNLRFDDTNPEKEDVEYVDSIKKDIRWLGFDWEDREYYASDYFGKLYEFAIDLIKRRLAYVDDQSAEVISEQRGTPTRPGIESPYRNRPVQENLDLFDSMKKGEFEEGSRVLRAKIDMASPNMHMRDPIMYRILKTPHHRTGTKWFVTLHMILPTGSAIISKALPTLFAHLSLKCIGLYTTGLLIGSRQAITDQGKLNSTGLT